MPIHGSAPTIRIELDRAAAGGGGGRARAAAVSGRVVVRVAKAVAVQRVCIDFVGEETVSLRAWVPLSSTTVSREVVRERLTVHGGGVLGEGQHTFAFSVRVPPWVPSSLAREMCRVRYVVRAVIERASLAALLPGFGSGGGGGGGGSGAAGSAWTREEEVECRRIRVSPRLARRKRIDQSVGCPDGSCHVRIWGALSRDVVKPGSQLRLDLAARTSDPRYGLRLLAASFAECVTCHVQVKGEERVVRKISNLATVRLDALSGGGGSSGCATPTLQAPPPAVESPRDAATDPEDRQRSSMRSDPGHLRPRRLPRNRGHRHRASDTPQRPGSATTALSPNDLHSSSNNSVTGGSSDGEYQGAGAHISRGIRKTRSRLAVLLRNSNAPGGVGSPASAARHLGADADAPLTTPPLPPPTPPSYMAGVAVRGSRSHSSDGCGGGDARGVVRQIQAAQIMQVPPGLSQFASEYVSREYRLIVVAEVARLEDPEADQHSVHTNDATRGAAPAAPGGGGGSGAKHARSVQSLGLSPPPSAGRATAAAAAAAAGAGARARQSPLANGNGGGTSSSLDGGLRNASVSSRSSPISSVASLASVRGEEHSGQPGRRRQSDSGLLEQQSRASQRQQQHRWAVAEQSSAIAEWTIDVVDAFDVQFDELVSPDYAGGRGPTERPAAAAAASAEMCAGEYTREPLQSPLPSPGGSPGGSPGRSPVQVPQAPTLDSDDSRRPAAGGHHHHHRRTSSGLVGFLMRGFRSSTPPTPVPDPPPPPPQTDNAAPAWRRHASHGAPSPPRAARSVHGDEESSGNDQELVMYPLQH